eukprot:1841170-Pyramimonas_sp.AAC.1
MMASKTAPEHLKKASRRPREAPKTAPDGVRRVRNLPRWPKLARGWPKTVQEASKGACRKARKAKKHGCPLSG